MKKANISGGAGRPRKFDVDQALETAMQVFWQKGYEGTSIADLTEAIGINRPSLYAAFGNKEEIFRKAFDRYAAGPAAVGHEALEEPTARGVVERLLLGAAHSLTDPHHPGCLSVHGALACGEAAEPIKQELCARRTAMEKALCARFERAQAEGDLPADASPGDLACYVATLTQGMAVQAAGGASREELRRVALTALRTWPV